jgi:hypothetical protein
LVFGFFRALEERELSTFLSKKKKRKRAGPFKFIGVFVVNALYSVVGLDPFFSDALAFVSCFFIWWMPLLVCFFSFWVYC